MSDLALACNVCSEAVMVSSRAQFAECPSCRARLVVVRTEKTTCVVRAADDEVGAVRREAQQLAGRVELLQLELDWSEEKARIGPVPSRTDTWLICAMVGFASLFCVGFAVAAVKWNPASIEFWIIGLAVALGVPFVGGFAILLEFAKIWKYENAYASYQSRREQLAWVDPETRQPPAATTAPATPTEDAIRAAPRA